MIAASALHALGLSPEKFAALSGAAGLPMWRQFDSSGAGAIATTTERVPERVPERVIVLLGQGWEDRLPAYRIAPYTAWIEMAALTDRDVLDLIGRAADTGLFASFTTSTANRLDLADEVLQAITIRRTLSSELHDNIELALHEALSNALIHGNLQVESMAALSFEALERFSGDLMRKITDPDFASRRVEVRCCFEDQAVIIDVVDQGQGFQSRLASTDEIKASGRGFALIGASCQSYQLLDEGRRVSMRFSA